jgi:hypothetical protein
MRRAMVAVIIIGGYAFWGIGSGLGHQPVIVGARLTAAVKSAKAAGAASQTVTFGGYTVSVPASWPVYDLTKNPRQCVRYDVHAGRVLAHATQHARVFAVWFQANA